MSKESEPDVARYAVTTLPDAGVSALRGNARCPLAERSLVPVSAAVAAVPGTPLYARLIDETAAAFRQLLMEHPLIADLREGRVGLYQYVAYLRETWHLVRHTTGIFALAAARVGEERWPLKEWLLQQACDEHGHEQLCLADLERLGIDPGVVAGSRPGAGAWGLVTQDCYYAAAGDPLCLLGTASLSEQLGATVASPVLNALEQAGGIPRAGTSFIRAHGVVDGGHLDRVQALIGRLATREDLPRLVDARLRAIGFSAQLLDDARRAV